MFCCDKPKEIGSFVVLNSEYIQEYVPLFKKAIKEAQNEYEQRWYDEELKTENSWRNCFRWFGLKPLTLQQIKDKIEYLREKGSFSQILRYNLDFPWYCHPDRTAKASRLFDMSRKEKRVFISSEDFDAVFRGDISDEITKRIKTPNVEEMSKGQDD